ncbi:MAG: hypothetical protein AB1627_12535, partial [Chloroflexota bacterium]
MTTSPRLTVPPSLIAAGGPALLLAAALLPELRPATAVLLVTGWVAMRLTRRPGAIAWAAVLPAGLVLTWPRLLGPDVPLGVPACTDPWSVIALRRVAAAAAVLVVVAVLARAHGSTRAELGLVRPGV